MSYGIRAFARSEGRGATASRIRVSCETWKKVGDTKPCTGTFRLTRKGRTADYRMTRKAATFLNSPGSVQYELYARTATPGPGLPRSTSGFTGFYQG